MEKCVRCKLFVIAPGNSLDVGHTGVVRYILMHVRNLECVNDICKHRYLMYIPCYYTINCLEGNPFSKLFTQKFIPGEWHGAGDDFSFSLYGVTQSRTRLSDFTPSYY